MPFLFASAIVWWSGVCTVAPGREEEKESKSVSRGSLFLVLVLEISGERDHHP